MTDVRTNRHARYPMPVEMIDPAAVQAENDLLRAEVERLTKLAENDIWLTTALSAATQIISAPEIESVLSPIQYAAWVRIKAGPHEGEKSMTERGR